MHPRLVIFDLDGTLVDSFSLFVRIHNQLARRHRFAPIREEEVDRLRLLTPSQMMRHVGLPAWKLPQVARDFRHLMEAETQEARPFEGVEDALRHLHRAGVRLAVVTSNSLANTQRSLGDLMGLIDHAECGMSIFGKRTRLRSVLRASGFAAADALYVGDQVTDLEAARRVPMRFAAVRWGYADPAILSAHRPDLVLDTPSQLIELERTLHSVC